MGVLVVMLLEIGLLTPPVGLNAFVIKTRRRRRRAAVDDLPRPALVHRRRHRRGDPAGRLPGDQPVSAQPAGVRRDGSRFRRRRLAEAAGWSRVPSGRAPYPPYGFRQSSTQASASTSGTVPIGHSKRLAPTVTTSFRRTSTFFSNVRYLCFSRAIVRIPIAVRPMDVPRCSTRPNRCRRFTSISETVPARTPVLAIWINAIASCGFNSVSESRSNSASSLGNARVVGRCLDKLLPTGPKDREEERRQRL